MRNLSKTEKFDVMEWDYSHLPKGRQLAIDEIILELIELDYEKTIHPELANKLKASITACQNEIYELYYKVSVTTKQALQALQENDFHEELLQEMALCNAFKEKTLVKSYKAYLDSEWSFQRDNSFFKFHYWNICVSCYLDIDGKDTNDEGNPYRGPYNMAKASQLLKQWGLGASRKNSDTMFTLQALQLYSRSTLLKNHGFQSPSGVAFQ